MVTMKELADECGVSIATVSKALKGAKDISADTSRKIQEKAAEMGYVPNASAQNLKTRKTNNIGVILDDGTRSGLTHEFFAHVLNSFKCEVEDRGYDVTLISNNVSHWGTDYAFHVKYRNCDGVAVLVATHAGEAVNAILQSKIPTVSVDTKYDGCTMVISDNAQGVRDLVDYVYQQGHRKVAAIFGEDSRVTEVRKKAFLEHCKELGLEIPDEYVRDSFFHLVEESRKETAFLLDLPEPPTCILYPDDFSLIGGKLEIEQRGLQIPQDISVAGFDGTAFSKIMNPILTTVEQDTVTMGKAAAEALIREIEKEGECPAEEIVIPCRLIKGGTVGEIQRG